MEPTLPQRIRGVHGGSDALFSEEGQRSRSLIAALLARDRPLALEIGFGHGHFLAALARSDKGRDVLGIEVSRRWVNQVRRVAARDDLDNLVAVKGDARVLLTLALPPGRLDHVFILFPDPWWKEKHSRRRRLVTPELLDTLERALRPGGLFTLRTDVKPYLDASERFVEAHPAFAPAPEALSHVVVAQTNREERCARKGLPVYERVWIRS